MFGKSKQDSEMEWKYYTIYDTKGGFYREPALARNHLEVIRDLENLFKNPEQSRNTLVTNPEDFQVFKIGSWDKETGTIIGHQPEHVINLHEIRTVVMRSIAQQEKVAQQVQAVPSGH